LAEADAHPFPLFEWLLATLDTIHSGSPVLLVVTTLEQFYNLFLLVLEDFERCAM
jgi:hypothetical protein